MNKKIQALIFLALAGLMLAVFLVPLTLAATPDAVIDDFEDGDASDWGFFGGNAAGGGGGSALRTRLSQRRPEKHRRAREERDAHAHSSGGRRRKIDPSFDLHHDRF